jgi:hypothetical protein
MFRAELICAGRVMLFDRQMIEDEICRVQDELLGELYRANKRRVPDLAATVAPDARALLALFCYRRSHLQSLGLTIAESCTEDDLVCTGGKVGAILFARSREPPLSLGQSRQAGRRMITLASGALRIFSSDEEGMGTERYAQFRLRAVCMHNPDTTRA